MTRARKGRRAKGAGSLLEGQGGVQTLASAPPARSPAQPRGPAPRDRPPTRRRSLVIAKVLISPAPSALQHLASADVSLICLPLMAAGQRTGVVREP